MKSLLHLIIALGLFAGLQFVHIEQGSAEPKWAKGAKATCTGIETRPSAKKKGFTCPTSIDGEFVRKKGRQKPHSLCMRARNKAFSKLPNGNCRSRKENCTCTLIEPEDGDTSFNSVKQNKQKQKAKAAEQREQAQRAAKQRKRAQRYKKSFGKKAKELGDLPDFERNYAQDWGSEQEEYSKDWAAKQGFPGVYDPMTGQVVVRPSCPHKPQGEHKGKFNLQTSKEFSGKKYHHKKQRDKDAWVIRGGGHEEIADSIDIHFDDEKKRKAGKDEPKYLRAFTLMRDGRSGYFIKWNSVGVNGKFKGSGGDGYLPKKYRSDVLDALAYHTTLAITDNDPDE